MLMPPLPVGQGETLGHIEHIEQSNGSLRLTGWACDGRNGRGCATVLAIVDGRAIGSAAVNLCRPDVQLTMNLVTERAGFELVLNCVPQQPVQVLALTVDGRIFKIADWTKNAPAIEEGTGSS